MSNTTLTMDDVIRARELLKRFNEPIMPHPGIPFGLRGTLMGMPVYEQPPPPPKLKLSDDVAVGDDFRAEFNLWLIDMFGYRDPLLKADQWIVSSEYGFIVAPYGGMTLLGDELGARNT